MVTWGAQVVRDVLRDGAIACELLVTQLSGVATDETWEESYARYATVTSEQDMEQALGHALGYVLSIPASHRSAHAHYGLFLQKMKAHIATKGMTENGRLVS